MLIDNIILYYYIIIKLCIRHIYVIGQSILSYSCDGFTEKQKNSSGSYCMLFKTWGDYLIHDLWWNVCVIKEKMAPYERIISKPGPDLN